MLYKLLEGLSQAQSWAWHTSGASEGLLQSSESGNSIQAAHDWASFNSPEIPAFPDRAPKPVLPLPLARAPANGSPLEASKPGSNPLRETSDGLLGLLQRQLQSWMAYCRQAVTPAALALALLYLTVLSFGTLMTAYLKWRGMVEAELSVYRG